MDAADAELAFAIQALCRNGLDSRMNGTVRHADGMDPNQRYNPLLGKDGKAALHRSGIGLRHVVHDLSMISLGFDARSQH